MFRVAAGTPAMTSRGLAEEDFEQVAGFLHEVLQVSTTTISNVVVLVMCIMTYKLR
jgi:glycine/serine hydroxymethyltransferase